MTVHKSQGTTAKYGIVYDPGSTVGHCRSLAYVACSRATALEKVVLLSPLQAKHFTSHSYDRNQVSLEYTRLSRIHLNKSVDDGLSAHTSSSDIATSILKAKAEEDARELLNAQRTAASATAEVTRARNIAAAAAAAPTNSTDRTSRRSAQARTNKVKNLCTNKDQGVMFKQDDVELDVTLDPTVQFSGESIAACVKESNRCLYIHLGAYYAFSFI